MTDHAAIVATARQTDAPAEATLTDPATRARERKEAHGVATARPTGPTARDAHAIRVANEGRPAQREVVPHRDPGVVALQHDRTDAPVRRAPPAEVAALGVGAAHWRPLTIAAVLALGTATTELVMTPARLAEVRRLVRLRPRVARLARVAAYRPRRAARDAAPLQTGRSAVALVALAARKPELAARSGLARVFVPRSGVGVGCLRGDHERSRRRGDVLAANESPRHEERERCPCKPHRTRSHARWISRTAHRSSTADEDRRRSERAGHGDQYSPLMTKNDPRMVPASFDFCRANLNRGASSAGTSIPSESLNPTARFFASPTVYITLIESPLS